MHDLLYDYIVSSIINLKHERIVLHNLNSLLKQQPGIWIFLTFYSFLLAPKRIQNRCPEHASIVEHILEIIFLFAKLVDDILTNCYRSSKDYVDVIALLALLVDDVIIGKLFELCVQDYGATDIEWRGFEELKAHKYFINCVKAYIPLFILMFQLTNLL